MYKKIKATKNNSLKKASVLASVAVLASFAMLANSERFGFDNGFTTMAMFGGGGVFGTPYFGNPLYGMNFFGNSNGGYDKLSDDEKVNYEIFKGMASELYSSTYKVLGFPMGIGSTATERKVAETILKSKEASSFFRMNSNGNRVEMLTSGFNSTRSAIMGAAELLNKLKNFQDSLLKCLIEVCNLLYCDKFKNPEKVSKAEDIIKDKIKTMPEVIKLAGLGNINKSSVIEEARAIAGKAIKCWFKNEVLDSQHLTDHSEGGIFDDVSPRYSRAYSNSVYPLYQVLRTLTIFNSLINGISAQFFTSMIISDMQRLFKFSVESAQDVNQFIKLLTEKDTFMGHYHMKGDFLPLWALLVTPDKFRAGSSFDLTGSGAVEASYNALISKLTDAISKQISINDLFNRCLTYNNDKVARGDMTIRYDFAAAISATVGEDLAKQYFSKLDTARGAFFTPNMLAEAKEQGNMKKAEYKQLEAAAEGFNSGRDDSLRFVGKDGTLKSLPMDIELSQEAAKHTAMILGMPTTLRYRALFNVLISKLSASSWNPSSLWKNNDNTFITPATYDAALAQVFSELQDIFKSAYNLREDISKVKDLDVKKTKSRDRETELALPLSNFVSFNGNNRVTDSYSAEASGTDSKNLAIKLRGLKPGAEISPVLCPRTKTADGKQVAKDVDLEKGKVSDDGTLRINLDGKLSRAGTYVVHVREIVDGKINFIYKQQFYYGGSGVKATDGVEFKFEQPNSILDLSNSKVLRNSDGSFTFRIKKGSAFREADARKIIPVFFKQNVNPNFETDLYVLSPDKDSDEFLTLTTEPNQTGEKQLHLYSGEVDSSNYLGKIELNSSKLTELTDMDNENGFGAVVSKGGVSGHKEGIIKTVEKEFTVTVPSEVLSDNVYSSIDDVSYVVLNSGNGNSVLRGTTKFVFQGYENGSRSWWGGFNGNDTVVFKVKLNVPDVGENKEYRVRFEDGSFGTLESNVSVNAKTNSDLKVKLESKDYDIFGKNIFNNRNWLFNF